MILFSHSISSKSFSDTDGISFFFPVNEPHGRFIGSFLSTHPKSMEMDEYPIKWSLLLIPFYLRFGSIDFWEGIGCRFSPAAGWGG
jgi:hypothetical protein